MIRAIEQARHMSQPSVETLIAHLPDLGDSLHTAAVDLAIDFTLERVDLMLARIKGAETTLTHLRKALAVKPVSPDVAI